MWPATRLTGLFGIEHPILQAPMAGSATPALAAAVSGAGGLGALGCADDGPEVAEGFCTAMRRLTNAPFHLNFFLLPGAPEPAPAVIGTLRDRLAPHARRVGAVLPEVLPVRPPSFTPAHLEVLLRHRPAVVSFHFGVPEAADVARLKAAGIRLLASASTVAEARAVEAAGCDAVIAQGWEAGGHRGSHRPTLPGEGVGTLALIPQVADAVTIPVIAAGGIGDGRGIAAAFALGAEGVQIGTAFLRCPEAGTDVARRALLATASDAETMVTDAYSGRSARARRSALAAEMADLAGQMLPYPQMYALSDPLCDAAAAAGDAGIAFHLYGQAAALARAEPAAELVRRLVAETQGRIAALARG